MDRELARRCYSRWLIVLVRVSIGDAKKSDEHVSS